MASKLESIISTLSLTEKVALNKLLASSIADSIGGPKKGEKRPVPQGVLAWNAFIKQCKTTQPKLFEGIRLEKDRLTVCKELKAKDPESYKAFVLNWKSSQGIVLAPPAPITTPIPKPNTVSVPATAVLSEKTEEEGDLKQMKLEGRNYLMDPRSKDLYATDSTFQSLGEYCGKFRPGNKSDPIDFNAEEG
jgi:hypothetical protein